MRTLSQTTLRYSLILLMCVFLLSATVAYGAVEYQPLVGIPGLKNDSTRSLASFINTAYVVLISLGALVAVFRISLAGIKYSLTDIVSGKSEAKEDIYGALLGLAILLIPFIVLNTINPNLTNINVLGGAMKVVLTQSKETIVSGVDVNNSAPLDRTQLMKTCDGNVKMVNNVMCCDDANYTGAGKCDGPVPQNTTNATGLDTNRIYMPGDIDGLIQGANTSAGKEKFRNIGVRPGGATDAQVAAQCGAGETVVTFNQQGGGIINTGGQQLIRKVDVCVAP